MIVTVPLQMQPLVGQPLALEIHGIVKSVRLDEQSKLVYYVDLELEGDVPGLPEPSGGFYGILERDNSRNPISLRAEIRGGGGPI